VLVLTWLHLGRRDVLSVHPRGDASRPPTGVFATRSPDRPNPIGLHAVVIETVEVCAITVRDLEAIDGTPSWTSSPSSAEWTNGDVILPLGPRTPEQRK
jgi:tRNA (Thr-GGU) A37 N-methylase